MPLPVHFRIGTEAADALHCRHEPALAVVLAELLDHSRRARATRVAVHLEAAGGSTRVTFADDGAGVADAALRRALADPAWMGDLPDTAPAGLGLSVLAARGATVRWRTLDENARPGSGLRLDLAPKHFLDRESTWVREDDDAPWPYGVAVAFEAAESRAAVRIAVEAAARHHPLPVSLDGEAVERCAFLDGAVHAERWRGLVLGVFEGHPVDARVGDVSLHGRVVAARLPHVTTLDGKIRTVRADADACPEIAPVRPASTEAAETPFLAALRDAARRAVYRALAAADPVPRLSRVDADRAAEAGIAIAEPASGLNPWRPAAADPDRPHEAPAPVAVEDGAMVMEAEIEPPQAQALHRALARVGLRNRVLAPEPRLAGTGWYERLPRVRASSFASPWEVSPVASTRRPSAPRGRCARPGPRPSPSTSTSPTRTRPPARS